MTTELETLLAVYGAGVDEADLLRLVHRLLHAIHTGDIETYRALCTSDLSCYETDVAPYRIDVLEFHLDLMQAMQARDTYRSLTRFDILTPRVQCYGDTAIVTYTRLMTYATGNADSPAPFWRAFNETRVFVRQEGAWKMAHFHRSHASL